MFLGISVAAADPPKSRALITRSRPSSPPRSDQDRLSIARTGLFKPGLFVLKYWNLSLFAHESVASEKKTKTRSKVKGKRS